MNFIYGIPLAPFVKKVSLICDYKNIPYEFVTTIPPIKMSDHFLKISPLKKIPVFEQETFSIADSSVIAAYLEKIYPNFPIYPKDPKIFAKALWIEEYADTVFNEICGHRIFVKKIVMPKILKKIDITEESEDLTEKLFPMFSYLEDFLIQNNTLMIAEDRISIADFALAVQFICLDLCEIKIDSIRWPFLAAYVNRLLDFPTINNAINEDKRFLCTLI